MYQEKIKIILKSLRHEATLRGGWKKLWVVRSSPAAQESHKVICNANGGVHDASGPCIHVHHHVCPASLHHYTHVLQHPLLCAFLEAATPMLYHTSMSKSDPVSAPLCILVFLQCFFINLLHTFPFRNAIGGAHSRSCMVRSRPGDTTVVILQSTFSSTIWIIHWHSGAGYFFWLDGM